MNRIFKANLSEEMPVSIMQSPPGPETVIDGQTFLYFGGTSYLGLAGHPEIIEAGCEAMRKYGIHSATSRSRIGTNPPVLSVEQRAAEFFGTEDAFYFSTGYSSNHIMVAALSNNADGIIIDEAAHYCVIEASKLAGIPVKTFRNLDANDLARQIDGLRSPLVMLDGVSASTGTIAPVRNYLKALQVCDSPALLLDDAHAIGVLGENGRGSLDVPGLWESVNTEQPVEGVRLYVCGTLAKAIGGFGGIIPGSNDFVARVRASSHYFDGASAPASAVAGSTARALEIVMREPELRKCLRENSLALRGELRLLGLTVPEGVTANFGVEIGDAKNMIRIHEALKAKNIMLPYIGAYAGIPKEGLFRFALFANHTRSQINHLVSELKSVL
jgi:8-amino-7-oxononanoate synthase